jgi:hypothetical protein
MVMTTEHCLMRSREAMEASNLIQDPILRSLLVDVARSYLLLAECGVRVEPDIYSVLHDDEEPPGKQRTK